MANRIRRVYHTIGDAPWNTSFKNRRLTEDTRFYNEIKAQNCKTRSQAKRFTRNTRGVSLMTL